MNINELVSTMARTNGLVALAAGYLPTHKSRRDELKTRGTNTIPLACDYPHPAHEAPFPVK